MSDRTGNPEIYTVPITGGEWTQLTNHPAKDIPWGWSPDGSQIAFLSDRTGELRMEIWVLTVD